MDHEYRKELSLKIARDIFMTGNELNDPCQRIQFLGGTYPDDEHDAGGMDENVLSELIYTAILRYQVSNK